MKEAQGRANVNDCRTIVVLKKPIVDEAFQTTRIKICSARRSSYMADGQAFEAGITAGTRISISSGALTNK